MKTKEELIEAIATEMGRFFDRYDNHDMPEMEVVASVALEALCRALPEPHNESALLCALNESEYYKQLKEMGNET